MDIKWNPRELAALSAKRLSPPILKALRKAGSTALRDMKAEANKRVRARKRIKSRLIGKAFRIRSPRTSSIAAMQWAIDVRGAKGRVSDYPYRQTRKGVSVEINKGKRTLIKGAFMATLKSGHKGVYMRRGPMRLPIHELLASRPVDALLHKGEAEGVLERGQGTMVKTFARLLPIELEKAKG